MNRRRKSAPRCVHCGDPCVAGQTDAEDQPAHLTCQSALQNITPRLEPDE